MHKVQYISRSMKMYSKFRLISVIFCVFLSFPIVFILHKKLSFETDMEQKMLYNQDTMKRGIEKVGNWIGADNEGLLYYFSAYMDTDKVVVMSLVKYSFTDRIRCLYFDRDGSPFPVLSDGYVDMLFDWAKRRYRSSFAYCKLTHMHPNPYGVALVPDRAYSPINYVPVRYTGKTHRRNFTVCVSPMHSNFNNGQELVEMIELNRILGADFFIFYNLSSAQNIGGILNYYQSQGLVEIIQFNLPSKVTVYDWIPTVEGVHYYGQFAALNDCVYRNKGVSRYVVNQDMDEFIIPRKLETWQQLMENLPEGSYLFRSTIFPKDWPDVLSGNDAVDALKFGSKTVLKQLRETKVFPNDQRTKWIVRPECIVSCATHDVRKTIANESCRHYDVPETKAIIHHYHDYGNRLSIMVHKPSVLDDRINMYKSELLKRLKCKWNALKKFMTKTMSPIGFKMVASGQLWF